MGQEVKEEEFLNWLTLENGIDMLSRNVGKNQRCVTCRKSKGLELIHYISSTWSISLRIYIDIIFRNFDKNKWFCFSKFLVLLLQTINKNLSCFQLLIYLFQISKNPTSCGFFSLCANCGSQREIKRSVLFNDDGNCVTKLVWSRTKDARYQNS